MIRLPSCPLLQRSVAGAADCRLHRGVQLFVLLEPFGRLEEESITHEYGGNPVCTQYMSV